MRIQTTKKTRLALSRETLRALTPHELVRVAAAGGGDPSNNLAIQCHENGPHDSLHVDPSTGPSIFGGCPSGPPNIVLPVVRP